MIEMELVSDEVTLIGAGLRYRALELHETIASQYVTLANRMTYIGSYEFEYAEASLIILGLMDFAKDHELMFGGPSDLSDKAQSLSDQVFHLAFKGALNRKLEDFIRAAQVAEQRWMMELVG